MNARFLTPVVENPRLRRGLFGLFGIAFLALTLPVAIEPLTFWTGIVIGDYAYETHELHHFVLGAVFTVLLLGILVQAVRPSRRVGALHTVLIMWVTVLVAFTLGGEFSPIQLLLFGLLVGMALTHPAGWDQLPDLEELDRTLVAVAVVIAAGALVAAGFELHTQLVGVDDPVAVNYTEHVAFGHYVTMAAAWLSIGALALYASLQGIGWRYPAYGAVGLLLVIGAASVVYPDPEQGSSLGVPLGIVAVLLAIGFVAAAEYGAGSRPGR